MQIGSFKIDWGGVKIQFFWPKFFLSIFFRPGNGKITRSQNISKVMFIWHGLLPQLLNSLHNYDVYITSLIKNVNSRFQGETFDIAIAIGKLLNFDSLISPCYHELSTIMNPSEIETFDQFLTVLSELPCEDKCNINNALFTQYLNLLRFTYDNMFHAANTVVNPTIRVGTWVF